MISSIISFSYISEVLDILFKSELNLRLVLVSEKLNKPVSIALLKGLVWFTYSIKGLDRAQSGFSAPNDNTAVGNKSNSEPSQPVCL